ncbi:MAG: hypothetical protein IT383_29015 [Deltaproteobacteria bacterium]|nr:hypothetical protein [Deltaproteobacteria bacterium]
MKRIVAGLANALDGATPELVSVDAARADVEPWARRAGVFGTRCLALVGSPRGHRARLRCWRASRPLPTLVDSPVLIQQARQVGAG